MNQLSTITSKRQLTIPVDLFKRAGFTEGQKVLVSYNNADGSLIIESAVALVEKIAGSVPVPKRFQGRSADEMVARAKQEYFKVARV